MADLSIASLRGGMNNTDPANSLPPDQCTLARDVEFFESLLGERRKGHAAISLTSSGLTSRDAVTFLYRHTPSEDETATELWAMAVTLASGATSVARKTTSWASVSPTDTITATGTYAYAMAAQSLHGKLFTAYKSAEDRLHVWDGTTWRRSGLAAPSAAPTAANAGVGSLAGTRYYRVRVAEVSGSTVVRRSEPTTALTFAPSGTGASVTVTRPTMPGEGETHWEIEASLDNANFYRLSRIAIATTTYSDTVAFNTGYAASGTLSEDIGEYTLWPSVRYLTTDDDRLIGAGSFENAALGSEVIWSPVTNDPGAGNDERWPQTTTNRLTLDGRSGGMITGISRPIYGFIYVTKYGAVYRMVRTGNRTRAYEAFRINDTFGALPGSLIEAVDQAGNSCLYALDSTVGPIRINTNGVRRAGRDIHSTWETVNINADVPCRAVFYADKQQVHWWVATNGASAPNAKIVLQVNETRETDDGVRRGWVIHTVPSGTTVYTACMYAANIDAGTARSLALQPLIGTNVAGALVQQGDTTDADNGTAYSALITARPIISGGLLNEFGVMSAAILAEPATGVEVRVTATRDYGLSPAVTVDVALDPVGSETAVIRALDDLSMAELKALAISFGDVDTPAGQWHVNGFAMRATSGQGA